MPTQPWKIIPWLFVSVLLTGCTWPPAPDCTVSDLVAPIPSGPLDDMIVTDLSSEVLWSYPAGYECQPDGFALQIAHDNNFNALYTQGVTGAFDTGWDLPTPVPSGPTPTLPPVSEFWWRVAARLEDGLGGYDQGPWSIPVRFFTGPICAPGVGTPSLHSPADGASVNTLLPLLEWTWPAAEDPGCIPEGYRIDLFEDLPIADDLLSGGTGNPRTRWLPGEDLKDCTAYRWFVSPMVDDMLGSASAEWGFFVDLSGSCAGIGGLVWHDECALPELGPFPIAPPPGCIADGGGYLANGVTDPGESGLAGITVNLGAGACPSSGLASTTTDADGEYSFGALADGSYCISIDALADGNDLLLIPGGWSFPVGGSQVSHEISVVGGAAAESNFGWDWQFLPAARTMSIAGMVWHDECALPFSYTPGDPLPEGCIDLGDGSLAADGIQEDDEPGIPGVTVELGFGACPAGGAFTTQTDLDGNYLLPGLFDGTYCISVDALSHGNDLVLIPGSWTSPTRDLNPQQVEITIVVPPEGVDVGGPLQNFGWDYQFLPSPSGEKSASTKQNANCRSGPGLLFPTQWTLLKNTRLLVEARDRSSQWVYALPEGKQQSCWLWIDLIDLAATLTDLPFRETPALLDASLSGYVFLDSNRNYRFDGGERGIGGVRLSLKNGACPGSGSAQEYVSLKDGSYAFHGLTPGEYCLLRDPKLKQIFPAWYSVTLSSGEKESANFASSP